MKLYEKTLNQKKVYRGHLIDVRIDDIELPDKSLGRREVVEHPGGVCIAAQCEDGSFLVVDQYRYGIQDLSTEFPAGKLEFNENPDEAILRELEEETGYQTGNLVPLGYLDPSPAYLSERIYLYYANQLTYTKPHLDEGEFLNVRKETYESLKEQVLQQQINDAKTIALLFRVQELLK